MLLSTGLAQQKGVRKAAPQKAPAKPAPAQTRWPVESIAIEGNHHYTAAQVIAATGLKVGQMAGKDEFEKARDRLVATGAFETVGYRFAPGANQQGYIATFQVDEADPLYKYRFEELGVPDADVQAWMKSRFALWGASVPGTAPALDRYAKAIQEYLASRKIGQKVITKMLPGDGNQFVVVFRPAKLPPAVAEVTFNGNTVIPGKLLQEAISGVAVGSAYHEESFRQLLDTNVRPRYEARGRVRVSFPKITVEKARDVEGLRVNVTVDEGQPYDLGNVKVDGSAAVKPEALLKIADFKTGDLANFDEIGKGLDRMRKMVRRHGFMLADAAVERKIDDQKHTVDLLIHVKEGPQYTFGNLTIQGLDLNGEAAVRRMWTLKEGKPFNPEYPDYFLSQVKDRGVFDNLDKTRSAIKVNDQTRTVDVTLTFH